MTTGSSTETRGAWGLSGKSPGRGLLLQTEAAEDRDWDFCRLALHLT